VTKTRDVILPDLCQMCGDVLPTRSGRGRPRLYCSGRCKARAHAARNFHIDINEIIEKWGDDCYLCGEVVNLDEPFGPLMPNVDHVIPRDRGGVTELSNLRLVHYACNLRKHCAYVCPHCGETLDA
jgi:ferredoxin